MNLPRRALACSILTTSLVSVLLAHPWTAHAQAASIAVSPTSGLAGSSVHVTGQHFAAGETVALAFNSETPTTVSADGAGQISTTITVPTIAPGTYPVTATGLSSHATASAPFTVTAATGPTTTINLVKQVTVNGLGYSTMGDALPGDTLTYALRYKNTSSTAAKDVTFVDYLQPGQTFLIAYNAGCSLDQASRLLTCALPSIGPSASGDVLVAVVVDQGFSGLLTNVAQVSAANAPTSFSNPTQVLVHATAPPGAGKLLVCGTVVASTSTGIIIGTVPLPFAGAVTPTGVPIAVGQDLCVEATLNTAGRVTALSVSVNLPNVSLVCGILGSAGGASAPTSVTLTGITFPVATGAQLVGPFVTGQIYCFTLDASGAINGLLSTTPTSATPVPDETSGRRVGHHWLS